MEVSEHELVNVSMYMCMCVYVCMCMYVCVYRCCLCMSVREGVLDQSVAETFTAPVYV